MTTAASFSPQEIRREIRYLAIPIIVESVFAFSGNIVFIALLGRIGSVGLSSISHVAAFGMASIITGIIWWLLKGLGIGSTIRVAQNYGAGDQYGIKKYSFQALEMMFLVGILCGLGFYFGADWLISLYKPEPHLYKLAVEYIRICAFGFPFLGIMHASTGILQGIGDTKTPMVFSGILNVVFILTGLPLIFGWIGEPQGVVGSAYSLVIGQISTAIAGLYVLFFKQKVISFVDEGAPFLPDLGKMWSIVAVGLPTSLENMFWQIGAMLIGGIMLGYGEMQYAANQIGQQAEAIANMPAASFGIVTVTLCGRAIGARNKELGRSYVREIKKTALIIAGLGLILLMVFPVPLLSALSNDAEVIDLAAIYLRISGFLLPFNTIFQVYLGSLKSAGYANYPMYFAICGIWLIRVPLSYAAASFPDSNIVWLWWVIVADIMSRYFLGLLVYKRKGIFEEDTQEINSLIEENKLDSEPLDFIPGAAEDIKDEILTDIANLSEESSSEEEKTPENGQI